MDQSFTPPSQLDQSFTPPYGPPSQLELDHPTFMQLNDCRPPPFNFGPPSPLDPSFMQLNGRYPPPFHFGPPSPLLDPSFIQIINGFGELTVISPTALTVSTDFFMPPQNVFNFDFPIHNQF
jgi:hypothetical protein